MSIKGILSDIDGTLYFKGAPVPGAVEAVEMLREKGIELLFFTNTDSKTLKNVYKSLIEYGFEVKESEISHDAGDKGQYKHYMLKEIYEQPVALQRTIEGRISNNQIAADAFGENALELLKEVKHVQIIACGTSYHSAMTARYWFESLAGVSCNVEIASEFRYRKSVKMPNSLLVTISQVL